MRKEPRKVQARTHERPETTETRAQFDTDDEFDEWLNRKAKARAEHEKPDKKS